MQETELLPMHITPFPDYYRSPTQTLTNENGRNIQSMSLDGKF